ncbi:MAG: hypothetical protein ABFS32_06695 [Bacteroidota bacterium]
MIVSKPKKQALFSIGVFILISIGLGGYNLILILKGSDWFFNYIMAIVFLSAGAIFLLRQLLNYKIISIGKDKIQTWHPLRFSTFRVSLNEVVEWEETIIQTKTGVYKQLDIRLSNRTIKLSVQENTHYQEVVNYLKKKLSKLKK